MTFFSARRPARPAAVNSPGDFGGVAGVMPMSVGVGLAWKAADVVMLLVVTVVALRLQRAPGRSLRAREQDRVVVARRG